MNLVLGCGKVKVPSLLLSRLVFSSSYGTVFWVLRGRGYYVPPVRPLLESEKRCNS